MSAPQPSRPQAIPQRAPSRPDAQAWGQTTPALALSGFAAFLLRFGARSVGLFSAQGGWRNGARLGALLALTACQVGLQLALNAWAARLYTALEARKLDMFLAQIASFALLLAASLVVYATHLRIKRALQFAWRVWLSKSLLDEWMAQGRHYQLALLPGPHDNPDGRIAEDVRIATESAVDLALSLLYCLMLLIGFADVLWHLSGIVHVTLGGRVIALPGHLLLIALVYALGSTSLAIWIGQPLVGASELRQSLEADFRFGLGHARDWSEGIALIRGDADERARLLRLLRRVRDGWQRQTQQLTHIILFTSAYGVLAAPLPILIVAPRYIMGLINLGTLMQTAQAFQQVTSSLSWPVDNLATLAQWRASAERVMTLQDELARLRQALSPDAPGCIAMHPDGGALQLNAVQVHAPDGTVLSAPLSATIRAGSNICLAGPPQLARRLMLAIAGLWRWGSGAIHLPGGARVMFLSERPYLPPGALGSAVCYPSDMGICLPAEIAQALADVGLAELAGRLHEQGNWAQTLTLAQQQRIGFARLLLHRPDWVFLADAADALDAAARAALAAIMAGRFAQATIIATGKSGLDDVFFDELLQVKEPASAVGQRSLSDRETSAP